MGDRPNPDTPPMTVAELVALLQTMPATLPVFVWDDCEDKPLRPHGITVDTGVVVIAGGN